jgi:hypothetical protein
LDLFCQYTSNEQWKNMVSNDGKIPVSIVPTINNKGRKIGFCFFQEGREAVWKLLLRSLHWCTRAWT